MLTCHRLLSPACLHPPDSFSLQIRLIISRFKLSPCCCSAGKLCPTLWDPVDCSMTAICLCRPLLLLPSVFPSIKVFSKESALWIKWPKYWSFIFSIHLSNECSGLIYFRIDWFDLAVQGTLESLLQHHSSKAVILRRSAFFVAQLSHPYMTTGKTIALTRPTFDA